MRCKETTELCVGNGIGGVGFGEAGEAEKAGVAVAAAFAGGGGVVAGVGEVVRDVEVQALADDLRFRGVHQRCVDMERIFIMGIDACSGAEIGEFFKGGDEFGAAVGVAGVVNRVDAEEDVEGVGGFGEGECEAEEDGVSRGDVGDGDGGSVGIGLAEMVFGDGDVGGEGGASEGAQIDFHCDVPGDAIVFREGGGGGDFLLVALAVIEAERVAGVAGFDGDAEGCGGVESAGEEDDGIFWRHYRSLAEKVAGFMWERLGGFFLFANIDFSGI